MESSTRKYCDIHPTCKSVEWCSLCEQALCSDCKEYHSQAKFTKHHMTISISNFFQLPPFVHSLKRNCDEHDDKLDFYCPEHEEICCFYCIQSTHKKCHGVAQLHKVSENVKCSTSMEDLENIIKDITLGIDKILQNRKENISSLDKQKTLVLLKLRDSKKEIIRYIDKLEKQIIEDLNNIVSLEKSHINKLRSKIEKKKVEISQIADKLKKTKQFASDTDTFIALHILTKELNEEDKVLQSLENEAGYLNIEIAYKKSDRINTQTLKQHIPSLGIINVLSKPNKTRLSEIKKKQAQIFIPESVPINIAKGSENDKDDTKIVEAAGPEKISANTNNFELQFRLETYLTIPGDKIKVTSCKILPEKQLLFLDQENQRIIFYGNGGNFIKRTELSSTPYDMAYLSENIVAVTLYSDNTVSFVDTYKGTHLRHLKTEGQCFGIVFAEGKLFICLPHQLAIQIVDPEKIMEMQYTIKTKQSAFNLSYCNEKLVYLNIKTNALFCISKSGESLWEYCQDTLMEPSGLTTNSSGDVFVACRSNCSVIIVSASGTKTQQLTREISRLTSPRALDFCSSTGTFIVCDEHLGLAVVFKLI